MFIFSRRWLLPKAVQDHRMPPSVSVTGSSRWSATSGVSFSSWPSSTGWRRWSWTPSRTATCRSSRTGCGRVSPAAPGATTPVSPARFVTPSSAPSRFRRTRLWRRQRLPTWGPRLCVSNSKNWFPSPRWSGSPWNPPGTTRTTFILSSSPLLLWVKLFVVVHPTPTPFLLVLRLLGRRGGGTIRRWQLTTSACSTPFHFRPEFNSNHSIASVKCQSFSVLANKFGHNLRPLNAT